MLQNDVYLPVRDESIKVDVLSRNDDVTYKCLFLPLRHFEQPSTRTITNYSLNFVEQYCSRLLNHAYYTFA